MDKFLMNNQHYFIVFACLIAIACLVVTVLCFLKSSKLTKSLLVNKFKVLDLNEKNGEDNAPLYTIVVSNNSMNPISVASIGIEHAGDYFNFRNECKAQLDVKNQDLVILPRGSIKLRLSKEMLEGILFKTVKAKKLGKVCVYIVGLGGETHLAKAKVIGKKLNLDFKEYYVYHKTEIISRFVKQCNNKIHIGIKLSLIDKIKLRLWAKCPTLPASNKEVADKAYENAQKEIDATSETTVEETSISNVELDNPQPESVNEVYSDAKLTDTASETAESEEVSKEVANTSDSDDLSLEKVEEKEEVLSEKD